MQLEYDVLKKLLIEQQKTNELLEKLITLQQPEKEVVSDKKPIIERRGKNEYHAKRENDQ